jgi:hypothetical protein
MPRDLEAQSRYFSMERHVPDNHALRKIDRFVNLSEVRTHLEPLGGMICRPRQGGAGSIPELFAYGGCTRAILNALWDASEPMTMAGLVERIALDCRIATEAPDIAATLLVRLRAALAKLGKRWVVSGGPGSLAVECGPIGIARTPLPLKIG